MCTVHKGPTGAQKRDTSPKQGTSCGAFPPSHTCATCGVGCYVLGRAEERGLAKAEDDGSPGVADFFDVCTLEQRESPHQIKT